MEGGSAMPAPSLPHVTRTGPVACPTAHRSGAASRTPLFWSVPAGHPSLSSGSLHPHRSQGGLSEYLVLSNPWLSPQGPPG